MPQGRMVLHQHARRRHFDRFAQIFPPTRLARRMKEQQLVGAGRRRTGQDDVGLAGGERQKSRLLGKRQNALFQKVAVVRLDADANRFRPVCHEVGRVVQRQGIVHIEPGEPFAGQGVFERERLRAIRARLDLHRNHAGHLLAAVVVQASDEQIDLSRLRERGGDLAIKGQPIRSRGQIGHIGRDYAHVFQRIADLDQLDVLGQPLRPEAAVANQHNAMIAEIVVLRSLRGWATRRAVATDSKPSPPRRYRAARGGYRSSGNGR